MGRRAYHENIEEAGRNVGPAGQLACQPDITCRVSCQSDVGRVPNINQLREKPDNIAANDTEKHMPLSEISRNSGVTILTMTRGKVNPLNEEMVDHLTAQFAGLAADPETKAVVLTGQGSFYSFGLDVPELYDYTPADFTRFLIKFTSLYLSMYRFPKPLVAAINGHAVAGGFMISTPCDYRVMATGKAKIALNEVTFGSSLFAGSLEILKGVVGARNAERIALSGSMYSAEDALELGMVDEIAEPEQVVARATAIAAEMAKRDATAYAAIKKLLRDPVVQKIQATEADSIKRFVEIWYSPSTREQTKGIVING
jgi:enoyl-CoA hydratase/carnithine racemase